MEYIGHSYIEAPSVTIYGGGGSGAQATARVRNGSVSKVTINDGGSNYPDDLKLFADSTGGSDLKISPVILNGVIKTIPVKNKGTGYKESDVVSIFDLNRSDLSGFGAKAP